MGALARCKIAVVDDDPLCLELVGQVLTEEGYEPILVADLRRTIAVIEEQAPDLIVLDLTQGYEPIGLNALRALRAKDARHLPAIVVSVDERALRDDEVRRLATATLNKPFDLDDLLRLVLRCLEPQDDQPRV